MSQKHDNKLDEAIRQAVGSENARFDADRWMAKYRADVQRLQQKKTEPAKPEHRRPHTRGSKMGRRQAKLTISTAIAAVVVVGIVLFTNVGSSRIAMAAVLERLQTQCYQFQMHVNTPDDTDISIVGTVLEPGRLRLESTQAGNEFTLIADTRTQQSLLLIDRFKAAYRLDKQQKQPTTLLAIFGLPTQSINNLWQLQSGDEMSLGRQEIDGTLAEGFQVKQKHNDLLETITVWADAETGDPLKIEDTLTDTGANHSMTITLSRFKAVANPDRSRFELTVPTGYRLANHKTIEQHLADADRKSPDRATTPQAKIILKAIEQGEQQGVDLLMSVDWSADIRFAPEHYLFTMTEDAYCSLVTADQNKIMPALLKQTRTCREMAKMLVASAKAAYQDNDIALAEKYLTTAICFGQLLDRIEDQMLIVRMVGIAIQNLGLKEQIELYEQTGDSNKLREAQKQKRQLEAKHEKIKANAQRWHQR